MPIGPSFPIALGTGRLRHRRAYNITKKSRCEQKRLRRGEGIHQTDAPKSIIHQTNRTEPRPTSENEPDRTKYSLINRTKHSSRNSGEGRQIQALDHTAASQISEAEPEKQFARLAPNRQTNGHSVMVFIERLFSPSMHFRSAPSLPPSPFPFSEGVPARNYYHSEASISLSSVPSPSSSTLLPH